MVINSRRVRDSNIITVAEMIERILAVCGKPQEIPISSSGPCKIQTSDVEGTRSFLRVFLCRYYFANESHHYEKEQLVFRWQFKFTTCSRVTYENNGAVMYSKDKVDVYFCH
jgi:hypothetical protein